MTRAIVLLSALGLLALPARAGRVLAVLSSDSPHYRRAFDGFQSAWGSSVPFVVLGRDRVPEPPGAVVAFGSRAALRRWPAGTRLVACLAPGARPEAAARIDLLPEPVLLMTRMKELLPDLRVLRVLWSSDAESDSVGEFVRAAARQGLAARSEQILRPEELPERLRSLRGRADAVWLMPDPALVNARDFAILREYAAAARVPFLAPTEGLARLGATATLAAPFREAGRAAAEALRAQERGEPLRRRLHPAGLRVEVNAAEAARVGLDMRRAKGVDEVIR